MTNKMKISTQPRIDFTGNQYNDWKKIDLSYYSAGLDLLFAFKYLNTILVKRKRKTNTKKYEYIQENLVLGPPEVCMSPCMCSDMTMRVLLSKADWQK